MLSNESNEWLWICVMVRMCLIAYKDDLMATAAPFSQYTFGFLCAEGIAILAGHVA